MRVLGVDPGTHKAGIGILEKDGAKHRVIHFEVIKPGSRKPIAARLKCIFERLNEILVEYRPDVVVIEKLFYAKDVEAVVRIGEARATVMLAAEIKGIALAEYAPTEVKKSVTGNGRAAKEQVQFMIQKILNLKEAAPQDASDALAVALCHFHYERGAGLRAAVKAGA